MAETVVESIVDKVVETLDSTIESDEEEVAMAVVPNQEHNDDEDTGHKCEEEPATFEGSDKQTSTQERQVKKTCEACVKSKVRCDGNSPCDRCLTRGVECFFIFEQKRGRRPGSSATVEGKKRSRRPTSKPKRSKMSNDTLKRHSSTESDISKQHDHYADGSPPSVEKEGKEIPNGLRPPTATSMSSMFQRAPVDHNSGFSAFLVPPQNVPVPSSYNPMLFQANYFSPPHPMAMLQQHQPGPWTTAPHHPPLPMPHQMMSSSSSSSAVGPQEMNPFERRVVRTLFALFKHHYVPTTDKQGQNWFETRFNRLWHYLEKTEKVNQLELHGFTVWMLNHGMRLSRDLQMADRETEGELKLANVPMQYRTVSNTNGLRSIVTITLAENGKVSCGTNNALYFLSGDFDAPDRWPRARILPFGAEIVAEIALSDADVYGYVRDMAVQYEKAVAMQDASTKQSLTVTLERPIVIVSKSRHQTSVILKVDLVETAAQPGSPRQQMITFNILCLNDGVNLVHEPDQILAPWPGGGYVQPSWINSVLHWARTMNYHHSS